MRASLITSAVIGTALASKPRTRSQDSDRDNPLPLVIWHGLGDSASSDGLAQVAQLADAIAPGIFVHMINPNPNGDRGGAGAGDDDDRAATFLGNVSSQVQAVCDQLASDPVLSTAPAIDALGFSQGGQFLRGYVERCNRPPVRNLITFGSQHNGITRFRDCGPSDWLCKGAMALLRFNVWSSLVQSRVVPAQYYRSTEAGEYASYLDHSNYLADINNERHLKNEAYRRNLASLENFVMYMFDNDTVSIPKESSWFGEVSGDGNVTPLRDRDIYNQDWLGLKALDDKGALKFRSVEGEHMQIPVQVLNDTLAEFLGRFRPKTLSKGSEHFESEEL